MTPAIQSVVTTHTPESLVELLHGEPGIVLLRSGLFDSPQARYSFVAARPFLTFRACGSRCEVTPHDAVGRPHVQFGNPWRGLEALLARYELPDEVDLPFPLGGCFGFWGYDLKEFVEPKLRVHTAADLDLPDCQLGFYASLVAFDHRLGQAWIIATGLGADGARDEHRQAAQFNFWHARLTARPQPERVIPRPDWHVREVTSSFSRAGFIAAVEAAQRYIHTGDIYQVNLAQRLSAPCDGTSVSPAALGWNLFRRLTEVSPAPFAAFLDGGDFQLASSSPEQFLRLSGPHIQTRPIKGTRPRHLDPTRDAQLAYELQTSAKEQAELVMITDLLRNDLGRVCEFGSVQVPDLLRLEKFAQVQHLVSTIEGRLRPEITHLDALAACFPGGSITGAPKFRAMEIIDELEPVARGPYCGALGYLGFNRESQLSILIRTAICKDGVAHFPVGAGIVADSDPAAEYEETLAKAQGFFAALERPDAQSVSQGTGAKPDRVPHSQPDAKNP